MNKNLYLIISALLLTFTFSAPAYSNQLEHVVGGGIGLPYGGGIGGNYEMGVNDYFAPIVGLGSLPENIGWNAGARLYYPGRDAKFRGRLTALYGTNTILETTFAGSKKYDTKTGLSGGLGINWRFGDHWAFDADFFVVDQDIPEGYKQEDSVVAAGSLGFSWRW